MLALIPLDAHLEFLGLEIVCVRSVSMSRCACAFEVNQRVLLLT
jgi:hypothetical protein